MELRKLRKTKTELELEVKYENETLLNPLVHKLNQSADVEYAAFITDHPLENRRRLLVHVKKGDPQKIIQESLKELQKELSTFEKEVFSSKSKK